MEKTDGGIFYPTGNDLASPGACRMFAESVNTRLVEAHRKLDEVEFPTFGIAKPTAGQTFYGSTSAQIVNYDIIVAQSSSWDVTDYLGFNLANGHWPAGMYLVGAVINYVGSGTVNWVSGRIHVQDWRGPLATVPHHDYIETLTGKTARADEFSCQTAVVEIHAPNSGPGASIWVEVIVDGSSISISNPSSVLWAYRIGGLQNA